jgi:hypothetical protein
MLIPQALQEPHKRHIRAIAEPAKKPCGAAKFTVHGMPSWPLNVQAGW